MSAHAIKTNVLAIITLISRTHTHRHAPQCVHPHTQRTHAFSQSIRVLDSGKFAIFGQRRIHTQRSQRSLSDNIARAHNSRQAADRPFPLCALERVPTLKPFAHACWRVGGGGGGATSQRSVPTSVVLAHSAALFFVRRTITNKQTPFPCTHTNVRTRTHVHSRTSTLGNSGAARKCYC